ncbi:hypothetical protein HMPREF9136_1191 [Prevotella dentalis DSM 3688]|uniref:Uncharacterized protein n=1 Tax=Prevotella dentalis (strain ATCC 49559 / DSM 3688 / JCM 13448 / NCTC 12043 / ES 2772) TaxID=908937 RepID=F9D2W3_PREDD|nr:hypothetical protein HMPREF9136_1191 [Prevotella dentalis DSM 3688]
MWCIIEIACFLCFSFYSSSCNGTPHRHGSFLLFFNKQRVIVLL